MFVIPASTRVPSRAVRSSRLSLAMDYVRGQPEVFRILSQKKKKKAALLV